MDCHCPLCARKAEYTLKERKTGIDEYQIRCEFCRSYYIEEWQDDVLEEIGSDGRKLISEYTRRIQANNGITGLNAGNIRRIVYSQKFAEKAAAQYGLHPARVEHSGGFDGANMLFFVDADGNGDSVATPLDARPENRNGPVRPGPPALARWNLLSEIGGQKRTRPPVLCAVSLGGRGSNGVPSQRINHAHTH